MDYPLVKYLDSGLSRGTAWKVPPKVSSLGLIQALQRRHDTIERRTPPTTTAHCRPTYICSFSYESLGTLLHNLANLRSLPTP